MAERASPYLGRARDTGTGIYPRSPLSRPFNQSRGLPPPPPPEGGPRGPFRAVTVSGLMRFLRVLANLLIARVQIDEYSPRGSRAAPSRTARCRNCILTIARLS